MKEVTLASLFDGIGGTPLCSKTCGAECIWASEIEPFPIKVTKLRFPNMIHHGDITKINGAEVEPVDIIVGGSPCQDLSVAGKRAGLKHADFGDEEVTRSGLFMEQIRIVKEMRNATNGIKPRFMVWENVPGAFSSAGGEDFRIVLEETARVADPTVSIPRSPGGWANSGSILGDGFSISWRTVDAQYWGVPQRRRRIYLVADFGGQSAPEILFESEGLPGDIAESSCTRKGIAEDAERCVGSAVICSATQQGGAERLVEKCPTITASAGMAGNMGPWIGPAICFEPGAITRDMGVRHWEEISPTLRAEAFDNRPAICVQGSMIGRADKNGPQGSGVNEDVSFTLNTTDRHAVCYNGENITSPTNAQNPKPGDPCHTLGTDSRNYVCYGISAYESNSMKSSNPHSGIYEADSARTIDQNGGNPACNQGGIAIVSEPTLIEMTSTKNTIVEDGICPTLTARMGTGGNQVNAVCSTYSFQRSDELEQSDVASTQSARQYKSATDLVVYESPPMDSRVTGPHNVSPTVTSHFHKGSADTPLVCGMAGNQTAATLDAAYASKLALENQHVNAGCPNFINQPHQGKQVRRLTAKECERLQGYPDNYTNIPGASDSARYKALGNSFAIPCAYFVISGCVEEIRKAVSK